MNFKGHELFVSRMYDAINACQRSGQPVMTSFLTPAEQQILKTIAKDVNVTFDGGYEAAERKIGILTDLYSGLDAEPYADLVCLHAKTSPVLNAKKPIAHPDILGALMHSGLNREVIGDILCTPDDIYLFCKEKMAEYIIQTLVQIKGQNLGFAICDPSELPEMQLEEIQVNVSSLRHDAVVAALAKCSRSKASELIRQGYVKINDVVLEDCGKLCNNDHVSIRRCGRFQFVEVIKTTRKDRMVLRFKKYI